MQFTLTGLSQKGDWRVFAYDAMDADTIRLRFTVRADLALSRRYGIPDRELPYLCIEILGVRVKRATGKEHRPEDPRTVILDEHIMREYGKRYMAARDAASLKWSAPGGVFVTGSGPAPGFRSLLKRRGFSPVFWEKTCSCYNSRNRGRLRPKNFFERLVLLAIVPYRCLVCDDRCFRIRIVTTR